MRFAAIAASLEDTHPRIADEGHDAGEGAGEGGDAPAGAAAAAVVQPPAAGAPFYNQYEDLIRQLPTGLEVRREHFLSFMSL